MSASFYQYFLSPSGTFIAKGLITFSGESLYYWRPYPANGGFTLSGISDVDYSKPYAIGGFVLSGVAIAYKDVGIPRLTQQLINVIASDYSSNFNFDLSGLEIEVAGQFSYPRLATLGAEVIGGASSSAIRSSQVEVSVLGEALTFASLDVSGFEIEVIGEFLQPSIYAYGIEVLGSDRYYADCYGSLNISGTYDNHNFNHVGAGGLLLRGSSNHPRLRLTQQLINVIASDYSSNFNFNLSGLEIEVAGRYCYPRLATLGAEVIGGASSSAIRSSQVEVSVLGTTSIFASLDVSGFEIEVIGEFLQPSIYAYGIEVLGENQLRPSVEGGILLSGQSNVAIKKYHEATGSINLSGTSSFGLKYISYISKDAICLEASTIYEQSIYDTEVCNFSLKLSGESSCRYQPRVFAEGGFALGGKASVNKISRKVIPTGNLLNFSGTTSIIFSNYLYAGSGQLLISGSSRVKRTYTSVGGLVLAGQSTYNRKFRFNYPAVGTILISGVSDVDFTYSQFFAEGSGQISLSGNSPALIRYSHVGQNGFIFSGESAVNSRTTYVSSGGLTISGNSDYRLLAIVVSDGTIILSGNSEAFVSSYVYVPTGQIILSGEFELVSPSQHHEAEGGVIISGESGYGVKNHYYDSLGGFVLEGQSESQYHISNNFNHISEGGLVLSGSALIRQSFVGSGLIKLSGVSAATPIINVGEIGGEIIFTSSLVDPVIFNVTFAHSLDSEWYVDAKVEKEWGFEWNVGTEVLHYYQIEGECLNPNCDNTGLNPNDPQCAGAGGANFIQIIAAFSLADLCEKYKEQFMNAPTKWPIKRIRKSRFPVFRSDEGVISTDGFYGDPILGDNPNCNVLTNEPFCHIPECFDFCLDEDALIEIGAETTVQDTFITYNPSSGPLRLSGTSIAKASANLLIGGGFTISGSAFVYKTDWNYVSIGGFLLEGESSVISDNWNYDANGEFVYISGVSRVKSSSYQFTPNGGFGITGSSGNATGKYKWTSPYALIQIAGKSNVKKHVDASVSGKINLSGTSSFVSNYFAPTSGGEIVSLAGNARVISPIWHYMPSGIINLSGNIPVRRRYVSSGGLFVSGSAIVGNIIRPSISGGLIFSGSTIFNSSSAWFYPAEGHFDFSGEVNTNWQALGFIDVEFSSEEETSIAPVYPVNPEAGLESILPDEDDVYAECACDPMPLKLSLIHNLNEAYVLKQFLKKNGFKLDEELSLNFYNYDNTWRVNKQWQDKNESWILLFEWGCVSEVGSNPLDVNLWKLSILIKRNVFGDSKYETRLMYTIPTGPVCTKANMINLNIAIDTNNQEITLPDDLQPRDQIIVDDIGMFSSVYWINNDLKINLAEDLSVTDTRLLDISPVFSRGKLNGSNTLF